MVAPATRRLAAIMFTDMVGYSALTQRDEALALELLDEHNVLIRDKISGHSGREIKTVGDAFLVEFDSALAAVQCAVEVQRALARRNGIAVKAETSTPAEPIQVRIGIHLGDVVYRENDVFGDGVNIAARVQSSAEGGEIRVSEDVARQVQNKIDMPLQDLGPTRLKNITDPVRIFSILADRRAKPRASAGSGASTPPETSIAVLAFANRSANADDEYFSDGLADELLNMLAKIEGLRVAARTSAFYFKGKAATVSEIGKTLNVATVLDGTVRKSGNRARISVQLVKVDDGYQIWSESYDRTLEDIFAVQDDIAQAVVTELRQRLLERRAGAGKVNAVNEEISSAGKGRSHNGEAYMLYLQARFLINRQSTEDIVMAIGYLRRAMEIDPDFAQAWAVLSSALTMAVDFAVIGVEESTEESFRAAQRALELEPELVAGHIAMCTYQTMLDQDWLGALDSALTAVRLAPRDATALSEAGHIHHVLGRPQEAVAFAKDAVAQDPLNADCYRTLSMALGTLDRFEECESVLRRALELAPASPALHAQLAQTLERQGRREEALSELDRETAAWAKLRTQAIIQFRAGNKSESDRMLAQFIELYGNNGAGFSVANIHAVRGEADQAFEWLRRGWAQHDSGIAYILGNWQLRVLHKDPRWAELIRDMGFTD